MKIINVKISDIKIGDRCRKDLGDLSGLAQSISEGDLLQPIGITPDHELVFGERRLRACRDILGLETISARIVDVESLLLGQIDENVMRKHYSLTEQIAIVDSLGPFKHGGDRRSNQARNYRVGSMTLADACKLVGISVDTYRSAKVVTEHGVPELLDAMDSKEMSLHAAETLAKAPADEQKECLTKRLNEGRTTGRAVTKALTRIRNQKRRGEAMARTLELPKQEDEIRLHHCSFQELEAVAGIEPDSVGLICTDPPYGKHFIDQCDELAEFAVRVLKPGGLFVSYFGHCWFLRFVQSLGRHLDWVWMNASVFSSEANIVHPASGGRIASTWKPVVIFSKGTPGRKLRFHDVIHSTGSEKQWHEWQQPLPEIERLVNDFSDPGDLVVDPCGGGFTTAIACLKNHRRFVGCDVDQVAVTKGQERLALERRSGPVIPQTTGERAAGEEPNLSDWVPMAG